ncbi:helix-turn-helix transcriptional regulator [Actinomadura sp. DC4]|uniref:helix-turn-helix domain-containing protein n=1 Tax=Actinomadura sp. DC4 TaxID=3055069 RepID=UPI0025B2235C|nr:helix-turn-helix transcriptional regulator [Actinomadura sp. DC4]MDN3353673.1 helix-turn-helix transcriptional regulator [Actinomadura sp. DC4]
MHEDHGPVVQRALLKNELVRLRAETGMTQSKVAAAMEWSEAKVIRVEGGKTALTKNDLEALLKVYGITGRDRMGELHDLSRGSKRTAWWDAYRGTGIRDEIIKFVGYEAGASTIRQSHNAFIPPLLQTPAYAQVVTRESMSADRVETVVRFRLQRRKELDRRDPALLPEETYVIDEAVIRRRIGVSVDPGLMVEQLYHLIALGRRDNINVHVIPFGKGSHFGLNGPFTILGFRSLDDVLYIESAGRGQVVEGGDRIVDYADAFFSLLEGGESKGPEALDAEESRKLIKAAAEEMLIRP